MDEERSLPTHQGVRHGLMDAVSHMLAAKDKLQQAEQRAAPGHTPLSDRIQNDVLGWIGDRIDGLYPLEAWRLCATALPTSALEAAILQPDGGTAARLYQRGRPYLERFAGVGIDPEAHVPVVLQRLSNAAITRMLDDGLQLVGNATAVEAATLWLTKGEAIGGPAWRKHFRRKNPALGYWERHGFGLPNQLHPDGAQIIAEALTDSMHQAKFNAYNAWTRQSSGDSRLALALLLAYNCDPFQGSRTLDNWFPEAWAEWVHIWTAPSDELTGHQRLRRQHWADHAPQARDVLLWERLPNTPEEALV